MKGISPISAQRGKREKKLVNGIEDNTAHSSRLPHPDIRKHSQSAVTINATDPEKLRNVNDKLKTQILTLSDQMGTVIQNLRRKKLENLRQFSQSQPSDPIKEKDRKLRTMQVKITQYKNDITKIKNTLDSVYNYDKIIELENGIKHKITQKNQLETEVSGMGRVKIEQERALNSLDSKDSEKQKKDDLHQELVQSKQKMTQLQKESRIEEKRRKETHSKLINLEERVRLMEKLMKKKQSHHRENTQNSKALLTPTSDGVILVERLTMPQIEEEIKQLEEERNIKERFYKSEIAKINQELVDMNHQSQKLELILKERDQEARLGQLKLRELRRKIPGKKVRPIISKSVTRPKLVNQKALKKTPSLLMSNKIINSQKSPLELLNPGIKSISHDPLKLAKIRAEAPLKNIEAHQEIKMEEQRQEIMNALNDDYANDDFEELEKMTTQNKISKTRPSIISQEQNDDINMYQKERGSVVTNQPEESMIDNLSVEEIIGEKMVMKPEAFVKGIYSKPLMKKAA